MHDLIIRGISWLVASWYSSIDPPKSLGWPLICNRPIRFLLGVFVTGFIELQKSGASANRDCLKNSCFASSRAILVDPNRYSLNF